MNFQLTKQDPRAAETGTLRLERVISGIGEEHSRIMMGPGYRSVKKWEIVLTEKGSGFGSVAAQLMNGDEVLVEDQKVRVKRVGSGRLRMVQFRMNGRLFEAIEQNREKPSRWGKLAREKHQVVQFRDVEKHKYVAVAVDGKVIEYGK